MPSRRTTAPLLAALLAALLAFPAPSGAAVSFLPTLIGESGADSQVESQGVNNAGHAAVYIPYATGGSWRPGFWTPEAGLTAIPLPPGLGDAWAVGINDADEVAGTAATQNYAYQYRAFSWSPATGTREILVDPSWNSYALSLNRFGTVGFVSGEDPRVFWVTPRPYLWHPDNTVTPLADAIGEPFAWPFAINDGGQVVGGSMAVPSAGPQVPYARPFRYTPGRAVERLGTVLGTEYGNAHGINRNGDAVVTLDIPPADGGNIGGDSKAILWGADGSVTEVAPPGGSRGEARFINDRGDVCGRYVPATPAGGLGTHAFYWSRATGPIDIGAAFPGESDADAMNELGHVVGFYLPVPGEWASLRGYFWSRETGVVDLGPGRAWAINDSDLLGGYVNEAGGTTRAVLWTRTDRVDPAPCSLPALLAKVDALEKAGTLRKGNAVSLRAKLRAAAAQGAAGKGKTAANLLFAFSNEVKALVKAGRLPAEDGASLATCSSGLCTAFRAAGNGTAAKAVGRK